MVIDAVDFVPQSRPRLFVIAVGARLAIPARLVADAALDDAHPRALVEAMQGLSAPARRSWLWWRLPRAPRRNADLIDLIEPDPADAPWRTPGTDRAADLADEPRQPRKAGRRAPRRAGDGRRGL